MVAQIYTLTKPVSYCIVLCHTKYKTLSTVLLWNGSILTVLVTPKTHGVMMQNKSLTADYDSGKN